MMCCGHSFATANFLPPRTKTTAGLQRIWICKIGDTYFYHDGIPSGGNGFRRTTAFREFKRMKDGRIPKINIEAEQVKNGLMKNLKATYVPNDKVARQRGHYGTEFKLR